MVGPDCLAESSADISINFSVYDRKQQLSVSKQNKSWKLEQEEKGIHIQQLNKSIVTDRHLLCVAFHSDLQSFLAWAFDGKFVFFFPAFKWNTK